MTVAALTTKQPSRKVRDNAIAEYQAARSDLDRTPVDDISDAQIDQFLNSRNGLLAVPAPNAKALADKLEIVLEDEDGWIAQWRREFVSPLLADARRLASAID